jgi:hypothetical protein
MSHYKTFAIWGAGNLGKLLVAELLELKAAGTIDSVFVLTRPVNFLVPTPWILLIQLFNQTSKDNETNKKLASQGVVVVPFDAEAADAAWHLGGIDVLISTIGYHGLATQLTLVKAAKDAGVKLFVPAEWGDDNTERTESMFAVKAKVRKEADRIGLLHAVFFHGLWPEFFV